MFNLGNVVVVDSVLFVQTSDLVNVLQKYDTTTEPPPPLVKTAAAEVEKSEVVSSGTKTGASEMKSVEEPENPFGDTMADHSDQMKQQTPGEKSGKEGETPVTEAGGGEVTLPTRTL